MSSQEKPSATGPDRLPVHFFTIVLNGEPFIRHHLKAFEKLDFSWHWHVVEGVADLKHDTAWSLETGGRIPAQSHQAGRSNDGTCAYLDQLAAEYPDRVTLYRKPPGVFWDGKLEMVNAPLVNIAEPCLLWQIDADELWLTEQLRRGRSLFLEQPEKSAAYYYCHFYVGSALVVTSRDTYGNHTSYEWLRTWRFEPGCRWTAHEPPRLCRREPSGDWLDLAGIDPIRHTETEAAGLVFHHYAYATEAQLRFKEGYYGYRNAVRSWHRLQRSERFPVQLKRYFPWVRDEALVDRAGQQPQPMCLEPSRLEPGLKRAQRVLIFRPDNIGDLVLFSGTLRLLRGSTDAHLTLAVAAPALNLLELCPYVDEIVPVDELLPPGSGLGVLNYLRGFFSRWLGSRRGAFDLVLFPLKSPQPRHLDALWRSGIRNIAGISGCTLNAPSGGYPGHLAPERLLADHFDVRPFDPWLHELELNRLFLRHLGCAVQGVEEIQPTVWTSEEDRSFAARNLPRAKRLIGIFPGASDPRKCWDPANYAAVAASLPGAGAFVLFGSAADAQLCARLERALEECRPDWQVVNLCGRTSLRELYCCISSCELLLCTDSAGLHLGIAAGIATVAVAGGWHRRRFTGWGDPRINKTVTHETPCQGCNWSCTRPCVQCLVHIDAARVADCVNELLSGASHPDADVVPAQTPLPSGEEAACL